MSVPYKLYQANCYDVFPTLKGIDAIVSDVPYGMNYKPNDYISTGGLVKNGISYTPRRRFNTPIVGDDKPFDPALFLPFKWVALFGAHHYSERMPSSRGWLIWDKKPKGYPDNDFSDGDLIWTNQDKPIRIFRYLWQGALRQKGENTIHLHPTEKPLDLMRWVILQLQIPLGSTICDPFMGSGTTGVAAIELGYKFIGIELLPEYFAIAEKRIKQAAQQPALLHVAQQSVHLTASGAGGRGQNSLQGSLFADDPSAKHGGR